MMYPQAISVGNILTFTPPGFNQELNVKFPDSRLAVCEKCKKNYKTRDMCRVRNHHNGAPWSTAYICITLDDSCTDENGHYIDKPLTVRMVQWQPFCIKKTFSSKHPVCSSCKKTNRTRTFCRDRHKHRQLPWCTVYVMLSALESTDPNTVVADPSKPLGTKTDGTANGDAGKGDEAKGDSSDKREDGNVPEDVYHKPEVSEDDDLIPFDDFTATDDINDIPESRTFLARVSYKGMSIHWLDLGEYDPSEAGVAIAYVPPPTQAAPQQVAAVDPNQAQYCVQMGYPPQQQTPKGYYYPPVPHGGQQQPYPGHQQQWQAQYPQATPGMPPVTAGEAAAQQQKQNQTATEGDPNAQQWVGGGMMYPPQLYQNMHPGQYGVQNQGQVEQQENAEENESGGDAEPTTAGEGEGEPDAKRFRSV
jgi:hypothetical protein